MPYVLSLVDVTLLESRLHLSELTRFECWRRVLGMCEQRDFFFLFLVRPCELKPNFDCTHADLYSEKNTDALTSCFWGWGCYWYIISWIDNVIQLGMLMWLKIATSMYWFDSISDLSKFTGGFKELRVKWGTIAGLCFDSYTILTFLHWYFGFNLGLSFIIST